MLNFEGLQYRKSPYVESSTPTAAVCALPAAATVPKS